MRGSRVKALFAFMLSPSLQLISFGVVVLLASIALRRYHRKVPDWAWLVLNLAPPFITWVCCVLGSTVVHELIKVRRTDETTQLLYAGSHFLAILPALFWGRIGAILSGLWLGLLGVLMLGDVWYYRFFGALPSILAMGSGGQVWEIRDSALEVITKDDWVLLTPILLGVCIAGLWPVRKVLPTLQSAANGMLLAMGFWFASKPILDNVTEWMGTRFSWKVFSAGALVKSQGLWGAHFRETARSARELLLAEDITPKRIQEVIRYHQKVGKQRSPHFGAASGSNVLLVQVEAMQQWVVKAKVGETPVMPFLSDLISRSVYYSNVWDLTGESPTSDCEYLVLNSQHPLQRGAVAFRRAGNDFVTLGTELAEAGYTTFSSHGYHQSMWNRSVLHPRYGFESSAFVEDLGMQPRMGWGLADVQFIERATSKLPALEKPWFGFFITLTSHHPYTYIPSRLHKLKVKDLDKSLEGYLHSMRYVDEALEKLFKQLEKDGQLANTMVVIYGDHDSKLRFGKRSQNALSKQLDIPPGVSAGLGQRSFETKKIPLVIVPPNLEAPAEITAIGGQVDIGPTVLDWLGKDKPTSFIGRVLTDARDGNGEPCNACGDAVRYDGSAVNREWLWDAPNSACFDRQTRKRTDAKRCETLRKTADQELEASWDVTMHDLAKTLRAASAQ